jgi:hypothetical protein
MAIWQFDLTLVPTTECDLRLIRPELDALLPPGRSRAKDLLIWGNEAGNCIKHFEDDSPPELWVRLDARTPLKQLVTDLIAFAGRHHFRAIVMSTREELPLTLQAFATAIGHSDAFRFVQDPRGFLEHLAEHGHDIWPE